jgi:hypothetical protein
VNFSSEKTDFLLINEMGKRRISILRCCGDYKSVHTDLEVESFYRKDISVTPIFKEEWGTHFNILKASLDKKSMILVNAYCPPRNEAIKERLCAILCNIDNRYTNTPIIIFGDMNIRRK